MMPNYEGMYERAEKQRWQAVADVKRLLSEMDLLIYAVNEHCNATIPHEEYAALLDATIGAKRVRDKLRSRWPYNE